MTKHRGLPFADALGLAAGSLWSHKLRSFLTLLGISMAVSTLIAVVSLTAALNLYVSERVVNLGPGVTLFTRIGIVTNVKQWLAAMKRKRITMDDYEALRDGLRLAKQVGASGWGQARIKFDDKSLEEVAVRGSTPNMVTIRNESVHQGRYVAEYDQSHRAMVAYIGYDVANELFGNLPALGKTITINGQPFQVIGVAAQQGSTFGQSQDNFVVIPLSTFLKLNGVNVQSVGIFIQSRTPELVEQAQDEARLLLRARRHTPYHDQDDFGIINAGAMESLWQRLTGSIAAVAVGISAIFLVVGGIVVMNIMLASVTERTREIGIRKSLGARRADILLQFMVESAALTTTGGFFGVALAFVANALMSRFTPMPVSMSVIAVVVSVFISACVGLFFGIYPAAKASRLDPIVALRSE